MAINRRQVLGGAGLVGASALGGAATDRALGPHQEPPPPPAHDGASEADPARFGNPRLPAELDTTRSHLFHLSAAEPARFDGGELRQAHEKVFPVLTGQEASIVFVTLEKDGVREPHWHPSAWEVNVVVAGAAQWTILEPEGHRETFEAKAGDVVFAPQGSMHYFENRHDEPLNVVIVFNASTEESRDDISVAASISAVPPEVLASIFGVPAEHFAQLKKIEKSVAITRRR
ncbi:MAG: cupin domain-containing protein [Segniliparus sp.]|uniref:cupin domain-containing protein n=1 Tax=Segniliparus sp. TaxID=2804064 RepID=UPI003F37ABF6